MADPQPVAGFLVPPAPAPAADLNRNNLLHQNQVIREHAEDRVGAFVAKFIYWFRIGMFFVLTSEIVIVLALKWNEASQCSQPLRTFLGAFAGNSVLLLACNVFFYKELVRGQQIQEQTTIFNRLMVALHKTTELIDHVIVLLGFVMLTGKDSCRKAAPVLWGVSVQIVALRMTIWFLPLFLMISVLCCFGSFLLLISKYRKWKDKQKVLGMLESIPHFKYKDDQQDYGGVAIPRDSADCTICLSPYENGSELRILPCNHHYHMECIDQWLCLTPNCPLCKRDIQRPEEDESV